MAGETSHKMELTRGFNAPVERVWRAWTESEDVKGWWGPMGFTCPVAQMDVRAGGTSLVCMQAPPEWGGQAMYNTWTYSDIVPLERLEFVQRFSDEHGTQIDPTSLGLPPEIPAVVPHTITFRAVGDGTELTVAERGYQTAEIVETSRMGMAQCLDKMAALVEGEASDAKP